ncbi:MAG: prolyl oligopeptidase family serine peptidase [Candidatus Eisenbacteria bacterium]
MLKRWTLTFAAALLVAAPALSGKIEYPEVRRTDVVDDYHGTKVADPYRWLEDLDSDETAAFVEAQNEITFRFLGAEPSREAIARRMTELWNYERYTIPYPLGGRYVFGKNDGLQNQSVLYSLDRLDGEPEVLLDPNTLSEDGTVALAGLAFSDDGRYMMYGVSESGSDWQTFHVRDLAKGKDLEDELRWIKFAAAAWDPSGNGFYYARFDEPAEGKDFEEQNRNQKIYHHTVGTPQEMDRLVYARPDDPDLGLDVAVTPDGRFLLVTFAKGTDRRAGLAIADLRKRMDIPLPLLPVLEAGYRFAGNVGNKLYFATDRDAPRFRVVEIDYGKPGYEHWRDVVPEGGGVIIEAKVIHDQLVVHTLVDVKSKLTIYDRDGTMVKDVALPVPGSVEEYSHGSLESLGGLIGRPDGNEFFFDFGSWTYPNTIFRYDFIEGRAEPLWAPEVDFDPSAYETKQVFYPSRDGTKIPMFIIHEKRLEMAGDLPTHIYAYGGFNINMTPYFRPYHVVWLEMGGVLAVPSLRGGGEYGEPWHRAGILEKKQNGIDDFIAACEYMIAEKYTRPDKLSIGGGSNGGLMVAAVLEQRPDLVGGVLCAVPVADMLRYHLWTIGWAWAPDFGTSDDPEQFRFLRAYSPLHNLKPGTSYPATLILTADHDDRVVPSHSFKFAAALQAAQGGDGPILLRVETKAGHGAGMPTSKRIQERADRYAFLASVLDMDVDF